MFSINFQMFKIISSGQVKKVEAFLQEVKIELREVRMEIKLLKENKTIKTGISYRVRLLICLNINLTIAHIFLNQVS